MNISNNDDVEKVAIVGMAGRFPGASSVKLFWENICNSVESIHECTDSELRNAGVDETVLNDPYYVKKFGKVEGIDLFDAGFFSIRPREAELMDPQHRLFLECTWEAFEDAGYTPETFEGLIGVYAGCGPNNYLIRNLASDATLLESLDEYQLSIGNMGDYCATRVSYKLNLHGPGMSISTACSSSLVAVHTACSGLLDYQCDMAVAGGVSLRIPQHGYLYKEGHILSKEGRCCAFDEKASGTVPGEGVGIVVLKRLEDALSDGDNIYAVISGTAINNDGAERVGFTAPSIKGQAQVISLAHELSCVEPEDISYVETHGTGTIMGDPIEVEGLKRAFSGKSSKVNYCALGAVKTNIGHLDAASGVTGLIKAALVLKNRVVPPNLHFSQHNPRIELDESPFYIPVKPVSLKGPHPCRAGVSSFGLGGTNAHVVLEEAPEHISLPPRQSWYLLPVSARSETALISALLNLSEFLETNDGNIADIAYTLQRGRKHFPFGKAIVCQNIAEAVPLLRSKTGVITQRFNDNECIFMFPGQGVQYVDMGRGLYENVPFFRETIESCLSIVKPLITEDLRIVLYPTDKSREQATNYLTMTRYAQPALFIIEYSLAQLLIRFGIQPVAMIGHSLGEFVAACISGVMSLKDAMVLIVERARIMQEQPSGVMLSVTASVEKIKNYCTSSIELAVVNSSGLCVVGGSEKDVVELEKRLARDFIKCRRLHTSHAFHTSSMQAAVDMFKNVCAGIRLNIPKIPFISNESGTWITDQQARDPYYWASHMCNTVYFSPGLDTMISSKRDKLFIEIGPGSTLYTLCQLHPCNDNLIHTIQTMPGGKKRNETMEMFLHALKYCWEFGLHLDWSILYSSEKRRRVSLPTYPFERSRYWVEAKGKKEFAKCGCSDVLLNMSGNKNVHEKSYEYKNTTNYNPESTQSNKPGVTDLESYLKKLWEEVIGIEGIENSDDFFELGGQSLLAVQICDKIYRKYKVRFPIAVLIEHPTIKDVAGYIIKIINGSEDNKIVDDKKTSQVRREIGNWNTVVSIQPNGDLPPFFCVAGRGGNPMNFRKVAKELGDDQPFYGLQFRGVDGVLVPHETIEDIALEFIEDMKHVQSQGPYYLGGYSFGGLVAYEMAQQLKKNNDQVKGIILFDTYTPLFSDWTIKERIGSHLKNIKLQGPRYLLNITLRLWSQKLQKKNNIVVGEGTFSNRVNLLREFCVRAIEQYQLKPIDTYLHLIKCQLKDVYHDGIGIPQHESNGWRSFVTPGKLFIHTVNSSHLKMFDRCYTSEMAKYLRECLTDLHIK